MRTKNELYQEAMRTVAARRQMARARAEDARAEAEAAIPALRHAEEEVRVRGIRCALAFFNVSKSWDAKPKFPFIKSSGFSGRLTPARLNTKSAFVQYSSNSVSVLFRSYS